MTRSPNGEGKTCEAIRFYSTLLDGIFFFNSEEKEEEEEEKEEKLKVSLLDLNLTRFLILEAFR